MVASAVHCPGLPLSARFALWFNAWVHGRCSLDDVRDAVVGQDAAHDVAHLPGRIEPVPLILALGTLVKTGARAGISLPVPGDPLGLAGPAEFNAEAMEAGEAVVFGTGDIGLVPSRAGAGVVWCHRPAVSRRQVPDRSEGASLLRTTLLTTAEQLATTGTPEETDWPVGPRWQPPVLPPGTDGRVADLVRLATRCRTAAAAGLSRDAGAAMTSSEQRHQALVVLDRAARRALVAACEDAGP